MAISFFHNEFECFPLLSSSRLIFRELTLNDSEFIYKLRSDNSVMEFMDTKPMKTINEAERWIAKSIQNQQENEGISWAIVLKNSNDCIGYFSFWRFVKEHFRAEIGFALSPNFHGNGYMIETMNTLLPFGFNSMGIHSFEANVNPENSRSINVLEKVGFVKEAYFRENYFFNGVFKDSIIFSLLKQDFCSD